MKQQNKLPEGWKIKPFEECLERESSSNELKIPQSDFLDNGQYPIIDQGDSFIAGYTNDKNKILKEDRPVIVFGDHTLILKYVDFPFALGADGVKVLVPKSEINPKYFYYYLKDLKIESHGYSRHYKFLKEKSITYPPLPTQKHIVSILEKAESLKQKREEADKLTKEYLQSVFKEMFGDKFEEIKLEEMCLQITDGIHNTPKLEESGVPMLDSKDIDDNFNISEKDATKFISKKTDLDLSRRCKPQKDDILISSRGSIGKIAIIKINQDFNIMGNIILIRPDPKKLDFRFIANYLSLFNHKLTGQSRGVAQQGLYLSTVRNLQIPLPPLPLQQKFASIVEKVEKLKEKQKESKEEINYLFDSLMQKAFKGELVR